MAKSKEYQAAYYAKRKAGAGKINDPEQAIKDAQENVRNLPQFTDGSEKQKAWAKSIRNGAFESLNSIAQNTMIMGRAVGSNQTFYNDLTDDRKDTLQAVKRTRAALKSYFNEQTSAKFLIEMRDKVDYDSMKTLVNQVKTAQNNAKSKGKELSNDLVLQFVKQRHFSTLGRIIY